MRFLRVVLALVLGACLLGRPHAATEMEDRASIPGEVKRAFLLENFSQLEEWSRLYRTTKSRTASGLWKLTLFYGGIAQATYEATQTPDREAAYQQLEAKLRKWADAYPNSPTAHIIRSDVLLDHAWDIRGGGYASTVPSEAWAPFRQYVAMARENLEAHKAVAAIDPRWYETMLTVARAESWDSARFDKLLNEALDREPLFYQTYFIALEYLLPKWHGSLGKIEAFARAAVNRTSKQEGRSMYARIYWYASQTQFQNDLFTDSLAVWPRMRSGFDDVIARYPDAWNLNNFAKFACLAKDKDKTRELLKRIGTDVVPQAWDPPSLREQCMNWAGQERTALNDTQ